METVAWIGCNSNVIFIPLRSVEFLKDEKCKHEVMHMCNYAGGIKATPNLI